MLSATNRERVHVTELQHLRNVERGYRSLGPQVIWVLHTERVSIEAAAQPGNAVVGRRAIVNRFGDRVSHQELQTAGERFFGAELAGMVDGVGNRGGIPGKRCELREGYGNSECI